VYSCSDTGVSYSSVPDPRIKNDSGYAITDVMVTVTCVCVLWRIVSVVLKIAFFVIHLPSYTVVIHCCNRLSNLVKELDESRGRILELYPAYDYTVII